MTQEEEFNLKCLLNHMQSHPGSSQQTDSLWVGRHSTLPNVHAQLAGVVHNMALLGLMRNMPNSREHRNGLQPLVTPVNFLFS